MNTYGLLSINSGSFNTHWDSPSFYPRVARNVVVTGFKIHNALLNVLGYMARFAPTSGLVRMASGLSICVVTLAIGQRDALHGLIIGRWYDEALLTGVTQIFRGALEALIPVGWAVNAALDLIGTYSNLRDTFVSAPDHYVGVPPHKNPYYPFPFAIMDLA